MSTQFNCQKHLYFKLFSLFKQVHVTIQLSVSTDFVNPQLNKCQNSSMLNNSV